MPARRACATAPTRSSTARDRDAADVEQLPYTTMVLEEASGCTRPHGPNRVPVGAEIVVSPRVTHRHPGFWDDPEPFMPERESVCDNKPAEPDRDVPLAPRITLHPAGPVVSRLKTLH